MYIPLRQRYERGGIRAEIRFTPHPLLWKHILQCTYVHVRDGWGGIIIIIIIIRFADIICQQRNISLSADARLAWDDQSHPDLIGFVYIHVWMSSSWGGVVSVRLAFFFFFRLDHLLKLTTFTKRHQVVVEIKSFPSKVCISRIFKLTTIVSQIGSRKCTSTVVFTCFPIAQALSWKTIANQSSITRV